MKQCERKECGSWENLLWQNHCKAVKEVPPGECPYFMTKEKRKKVESEIKIRGLK